ncbi:NAD(P)-dependent oxidoreductase [Nitrospirillum sp. BR 11164]|uniref:NAD(P)-dependent oxidoreductase n=1 Tax=Nitrospirillum sp. BR 11164 TaxID=3104324 RepID=UPI002AFFF701|nr:NAD(P)-dependent oxidoreductase [Nitrospirillum sp. BR 11164]MEA1651658.1 NAD(P)-dependent oxidoreductase [Nitrospirillum sp. BR 11164]
MKIALIGATGNVGTRILAELRRRGHTVTAIARDVSKVRPQDGVTAKAGDTGDAAGLAPLLAGHDAVISSTRFQGLDLSSLLSAINTAGVKRLLVVGGAGSLEVAPGVALIDTPEFPAAYKAEAGAGRDVLNALRQGDTGVEWTFLSPSAFFFAGERTGRFRLADDQLLVDATGKSQVSYEDFAVALVDEVESPAHANRRFTVGY